MVCIFMQNEQLLTLDPDDPKVKAARQAETNLFDYYGLKAKDRYIPIPGQGLKMRISEMGSGKPVLLVPGNTGDVFPLAPLLAELKDRRVIALNRPGGGLSEGMDHTQVNIRSFAVETIAATLDAFDLDTVDIVAHSMGAHWSLWMAMDRPERVRSLTLLGNPGNVMGGRPPLLLRVMLKWPFNKLLYKILTGLRRPGEMGEANYCFRRLPHFFLSLTTLLKNAAPVIDAAQLGGVKQRTQLVWGEKDSFGSVGLGRRIAAAMPHCTLHVIEGGSHLPWLEKPAECGLLVRRFLDGV
jgi:pimeloyl-ACP methyl ester carboxylesterase